MGLTGAVLQRAHRARPAVRAARLPSRAVALPDSGHCGPY